MAVRQCKAGCFYMQCDGELSTRLIEKLVQSILDAIGNWISLFWPKEVEDGRGRNGTRTTCYRRRIVESEVGQMKGNRDCRLV